MANSNTSLSNFVSSCLSIYTAYYTLFFIHKPVLYTSNPRINSLASSLICPLFLLPFGFINSLYQVIRNVNIIKNKIKKEVMLTVEKDVQILIEIYEPLPKKNIGHVFIRRILPIFKKKGISTQKVKKKRISEATFVVIRVFLLFLRILFQFPSTNVLFLANVSNRVSKCMIKLTVFLFKTMTKKSVILCKNRLIRRKFSFRMRKIVSKIALLSEKNNNETKEIINNILNGSNNILNDSKDRSCDSNNILDDSKDRSCDSKDILDDSKDRSCNSKDRLCDSKDRVNDNTIKEHVNNEIPQNQNKKEQKCLFSKSKMLIESIYKRKADVFKNNNRKPDTNHNEPIEDNILLVHGLNGTSRSTYIKGITNVFLQKKCRVFCFNVRGAVIPTSSRNTFNHIGHTEDIEKAIDYILKNYSGKLSIIGFSLGANWVANFLAKMKEENIDISRIKLGVGVCCPFNFNKLKSFYQKSIVGKMLNYCMGFNYKRYIRRSMVEPPEGLKKCKLLEEVDNLLLKDIFQHESLEEFYKESSCSYFIENIKVPMLFISASDDPLIPKWVIPVEKHLKNTNLAFVILRGGHLGFFANGPKTNAEILIEKYFDIISDYGIAEKSL